MSATVLVTGATGFLATHIVDQLLNQGYKVIGTGRSEKSYSASLKDFKAKYPNGDLTYENVPDIGIAGAFDELFQAHTDIKYVLHTASPFTYGLGKDYDAIFINPAVNGTLNVLTAIKRYAPQVERVVLTSSFAAVLSDPHKPKYTSADWNPIEKDQITNENEAYRVSKKYAEKAAWKFVEEEKPNFKLATVNPPFIFGPQAFDSGVGKTLNTSNQVIANVLKLDPSHSEFLAAPAQFFVNVEDVAAFHILPLTNDKMLGHRLLVVAGKFVGQQIADAINGAIDSGKLPELKGKVAKGDPEHADPLAGIPDYDISDVIGLIDGGYEFIPFDKTIVDVVDQLVRVNK